MTEGRGVFILDRPKVYHLYLDCLLPASQSRTWGPTEADMVANGVPCCQRCVAREQAELRVLRG
jgi:hypothetical protein